MDNIEYNIITTMNDDISVGIDQDQIGLYSKYTDDTLLQILAYLFVKNCTEKHIEIADALKSGDIAHAHRLAHNLKSNAGQLKLYDLQNAAGTVEDSLENGENNVTEHEMKILETELVAAIKELSS